MRRKSFPLTFFTVTVVPPNLIVAVSAAVALRVQRFTADVSNPAAGIWKVLAAAPSEVMETLRLVPAWLDTQTMVILHEEILGRGTE